MRIKELQISMRINLTFYVYANQGLLKIYAENFNGAKNRISIRYFYVYIYLSIGSRISLSQHSFAMNSLKKRAY